MQRQGAADSENGSFQRLWGIQREPQQPGNSEIGKANGWGWAEWGWGVDS